MKIKLFKFPIFKTNVFFKHLKFWNKAKSFKCMSVVSTGKKCKKQCTLCKRAYAPKK